MTNAWDRASPETRRRTGLGLLAVALLAFGVAYLQISPSLRWHPEIVAALSLLGAACSAVLTCRPQSSFAYRCGGTATVGAMLFHIASIILGALNNSYTNVMALAVAHCSLSSISIVLFSIWWLYPVKRWHMEHRRAATDFC